MAQPLILPPQAAQTNALAGALSTGGLLAVQMYLNGQIRTYGDRKRPICLVICDRGQTVKLS